MTHLIPASVLSNGSVYNPLRMCALTRQKIVEIRDSKFALLRDGFEVISKQDYADYNIFTFVLTASGTYFSAEVDKALQTLNNVAQEITDQGLTVHPLALEIIAEMNQQNTSK